MCSHHRANVDVRKYNFWSLFGQPLGKKEILPSLNWFPTFKIFETSQSIIFHRIPSVKTLETLAKIMHILTYSRLLLKVLIRSCSFLLHANLLKFLIVFLVRVLSRVSREWISCKTNINFVYKYFAVVRTTSYTIIL